MKKFFTNKSVIQKIAIAIIVVILFTFCIPRPSFAADESTGEQTNSEQQTSSENQSSSGEEEVQFNIFDSSTYLPALMNSVGNVAGTLTRELIQAIASLGDIVVGGIDYFLLGAHFNDAMVGNDDRNVTGEGEGAQSWLFVKEDEEPNVDIDASAMDSNGWMDLWPTGLGVPNFLVSPETIFSNSIAALDVNFLNPNKFESVIVSGSDVDAKDAANKSKSGAEALKEQIGTWYRTFRNLAVVLLLIVLVYLAIRVVISSAAAEKAKYKEAIKNWLIALFLVFFIHVIMAGILMITEKFTGLFNNSLANDLIVHVTDVGNGWGKLSDKDKDLKFHTNIMGLARFRTQSNNLLECGAFTFIYLLLVYYTIKFIYIYYKRFIFIAFLTMIAPLVAITYPVDIMGDRSSTGI